MKRKFSIALATMMLIASLVATPAMAEKKVPEVNAPSTDTKLALTPAEKEVRIREIVDERVLVPDDPSYPRPPGEPPVPVPARFPVELRLLTILTLDLSLGDLLGDPVAHSKGMSIHAVIKAMQANWAIYKSMAQRDLYFKSAVNYTEIDTGLTALANALRNSHKGIPWRKLYTDDIEYERNGGRIQPNPSNRDLFDAFRALARNGVGGEYAYPLFPFLSLTHKTPVDSVGKRPKIEGRLNANWLGLVSDLSYYELFTKTYEDVSLEVDQAVQGSHQDQILRVKGPLTNVYGYSPGIRPMAGNDCCCQNLNSNGKKACFDLPDLGCTNTGSPARCTLGSIACPAGTACP